MNVAFWGLATLCLLLSVAYYLLCQWLLRGWGRLREEAPPADYLPGVSVSVVIPARNEAAHIRACVQSVLAQEYPAGLMEVIVVDDHSEDDTAAIVKGMTDPCIQLLSLQHLTGGLAVRSYKKKAIETAVTHARGAIIVCTDADCVAPPRWLRHIAWRYEQKGAQCVLGPVIAAGSSGFLQRFQALDMAGLMLCTGALAGRGQALLANGANLAYTKTAFEQVGGFEGIDHLASGDDLMLMHKMAARFPNGLVFAKHPDAMIQTPVQPDWTSFWRQRIRWATKTTRYQHPGLTLALAGIFLYSLTMPLSLIGSVLAGSGQAMAAAFVSLGIKTLADYRLLKRACQYAGQPWLLRHFALSELMHIAYMIGIGVLGNVVKRYEWKGRQVQ